MSRFWNLIYGVHSLAGPVLMLLYPLYASVVAIESPSKVDDEQWLAYWILYSFVTLTEMVLQPVLEWIPIWYTVKLVLAAWLVLPQFRGAAFIYERFVRQQIRQYRGGKDHHQHHHRKSSPTGTGRARASLWTLLCRRKGSTRHTNQQEEKKRRISVGSCSCVELLLLCALLLG